MRNRVRNELRQIFALHTFIVKKSKASYRVCCRVQKYIFLTYSRADKLFRTAADSCRHLPEIENLLFWHLTNKKLKTKPLF